MDLGRMEESDLRFIILIVCLGFSGIFSPWFLLLGPFLIFFLDQLLCAGLWLQRTGLLGLFTIRLPVIVYEEDGCSLKV